jgi:hypothetical protein
VVLGVNGVIVDGCPVYPAPTPTSQPVTVPLPNNSTIEIHRKQFQFCYPPKELRAALISTPSRPGDSTPERLRRRRKTLRMSMIQSAQFFTPRPSNDPRENLRILKTPIKSPFKPPFSARSDRRLSSPLKRGVHIPDVPEDDEDEDEEEDNDIVLVESNHPRVVEEDRDLVILEHVFAPEPEPEPLQPTVQYPIPQSAQSSPQMQQTPPRRRQNPRASLHRAVLLRSAHRTAMRREMEAEEEREAEEVEEIFEQVEQMQDLEAEDEDEEAGAEGEGQEQEQQLPQTPATVSGWRKSLDAMRDWAFRGTSVAQSAEEDDVEEQEEEMHDADVCHSCSLFYIN